MAQIIINLATKKTCSGQNTTPQTISKTALSGCLCEHKSSFSTNNDQLATSLGFCIATNLQSIAKQNKIDLKDMTISITKYLKHKPVQTSCIYVEIILPLPIDGKLQRKFDRAIRTCPVFKGIDPRVNIRTMFKINKPLLESNYV